MVSNTTQLEATASRCADLVSDVQDPRIAIWGITFKAGTDDVRESPAVWIAEALAARGIDVVVHDPAAARAPRDTRRAAEPVEACRDADLLVVLTEWSCYRDIDLAEVVRAMATPLAFDARDLLCPDAATRAGLDLTRAGRPG